MNMRTFCATTSKEGVVGTTVCNGTVENRGYRGALTVFEKTFPSPPRAGPAPGGPVGLRVSGSVRIGDVQVTKEL